MSIPNDTPMFIAAKMAALSVIPIPGACNTDCEAAKIFIAIVRPLKRAIMTVPPSIANILETRAEIYLDQAYII